MRRYLSGLLVISILALSFILTACTNKSAETTPALSETPPVTTGTAPTLTDYSGLGLTDDEIRWWEERGVASVESAEAATILAGFEVRPPAYIPDDFSSGNFSVTRSGAGLPEKLKPKFDNTKVFQSFTWQEDKRVGFILFRYVHPIGLGDGEPANICGYQGEKAFDEADPDNLKQPYAVLSLAWGANGKYFTLMGSLSGPLDEETLEKIACSIRID